MLTGLFRRPFQDEHETQSKVRVTTFQGELNEKGLNEADLKELSARLDAQIKIEDYMVKWREANHAWLKLWGPLFISLAVAFASWQGYFSHSLEERKANAEIVRNAVRANPAETAANLDALVRAHLLEMKPEEIKELRSLTPAPLK